MVVLSCCSCFHRRCWWTPFTCLPLFWFLKCNQIISYLLLILLKIKCRYCVRFSHPNHHESLNSLTWTHFQITLITCTSLMWPNTSVGAIFQRLICLPSPIVGICLRKLLPMNACFIAWQRCGTKVHTTHFALKSMNMVNTIQAPTNTTNMLQCTSNMKHPKNFSDH